MSVRRIIALGILVGFACVHAFVAWLWFASDPVPEVKAKAVYAAFQRAAAGPGGLTREAARRIADENHPGTSGGGTLIESWCWAGTHLEYCVFVEFLHRDINDPVSHPNDVVKSIFQPAPGQYLLRDLPKAIAHPWGEGIAGIVLLLCAAAGFRCVRPGDRRALFSLALPGAIWLIFAMFWDGFIQQSEFNVFAVPFVAAGLYAVTTIGLGRCAWYLWRPDVVRKCT